MAREVLRRSSSAPVLPCAPESTWEVEEGEEYRESAEYAKWYYSQFPRDPRVLPPVVSHETHCAIVGAKNAASRTPNHSTADATGNEEVSACFQQWRSRRLAAQIPTALPALVEDRESSDDEMTHNNAAKLHDNGALPPAVVKPLTKVAAGLNSMAAPFIPGAARAFEGYSPQTSSGGATLSEQSGNSAYLPQPGYRVPSPHLRQSDVPAGLRRIGSVPNSSFAEYNSAYSTPTSVGAMNGARSPPATPPMMGMLPHVPQYKARQLSSVGTPMGTPLAAPMTPEQGFEVLESPTTPVSNGSFSLNGSVRQGVVRSKVLEEYCNTCHVRAWEIKDLAGCIVDFAKDPDGACLLQRKLDCGRTEEDVAFVFAEVQGSALQLMHDPFGYYVIQKLIEHGDDSMRDTLYQCIQVCRGLYV